MADVTQGLSFAVVDELGIDPLREGFYDAVANVQSFSYYIVDSGEEFNAPLISYNAYLNESYWRAILVYNGIADMFALKEGLRIKIPALGELASALSTLLSEQSDQTATVRI